MGKYYTMTQMGVASAAPATFTHSLSITPANLIARIIPHQLLQTNTAPLMIATIGTDVVTVQSAVGALQTFDLEVQHIHSLIS